MVLLLVRTASYRVIVHQRTKNVFFFFFFGFDFDMMLKSDSQLVPAILLEYTTRLYSILLPLLFLLCTLFYCLVALTSPLPLGRLQRRRPHPSYLFRQRAVMWWRSPDLHSDWVDPISTNQTARREWVKPGLLQKERGKERKDSTMRTDSSG